MFIGSVPAGSGRGSFCIIFLHLLDRGFVFWLFLGVKIYIVFFTQIRHMLVQFYAGLIPVSYGLAHFYSC